jgi:DNA primase
VTSLRFRRLDDRGPKYMTVAGDIPRIYNTAALERGTRAICVTEGEMDCIIAEEVGLPTVGVPGANAWNPIWARLLAIYDAVYVLADDDDAGGEFAYTLGKALDNVRHVPMNDGDVNSFFLERGAEALRRKVGVR